MKKNYLLLSLLLVGKVIFAQCSFTITPNIIQNVLCSGDSNGVISASVNGGTGPFSYQWTYNGSQVGSTDTVIGLAAGTYWVHVTDQGVSCTDSASITLSQPNPISVNGNPTPSCMNGANGMICLTVNGGTAAYSYAISPNFGAPSGGCFYNLPAANYTITVTDANGCVSNNTFVVPMSPPINISFTNTDATCGACNGSSSVNASGGNPPYTYQWNTGFTAPTATNLCVGTYSCTVIDGMGCSATMTTSIGQGNASINPSLTIVPAACGQNNGSILVDSITGGYAPYQYSLNGAAYQASGSFNSLNAGTYTLDILDSVGCSFSGVYGVTNSNFNAQFTAVPPDCNQCNGSLSANIVGGTGPYSYNWNNGGTAPLISGLCEGNYHVSVTDVNGCFTYAAISLVNPNAPVLTLDSISNATCSNLGYVALAVSGGSGLLTYSWTPNVSSANAANNLAPGTYSIMVSDTAGCTSTLTVGIANNQTLYTYFSNLSLPNCTTNGSLTVNEANGTPPFTYLWSNGDTTATAQNLSNGSVDVVVTDAGGCQSFISYFLPTSCHNIIMGKVYNDLNQNCIQDPGEAGIAGRYLNTSDNFCASTDNNGNYTIISNSINPTVSVGSAYPGMIPYAPVCPATGMISESFPSSGGDTITGVDFAMYLDTNYVNLAIHPGWSSGHPGFAQNYWIYFSNNSATSQNAVITFNYDPQIQFDSCNAGGVHNLAQHTITWTYNNLPAIKNWDWVNDPHAYFTIPVSVSIYDSLQMHFEITPIAGDITPLDNVLDITELVTGSRDPNEKSVIPQGGGPEGYITTADSSLLYTVHFQNNGNDTAFTVIVIDTISPYLEPTSLIPGAANHPYTFEMYDQGVTKWAFNSIMLPDSMTNEPESNGYFNYKINLKPGLPAGTQIKNTAYIYFDYNDAVVTNTTLNTIAVPLGVSASWRDNGKMLIYPNPTNSSVMVQFELNDAADTQVEVFDMLGSCVKTQKINHAQKGMNLTSMDLSALNSGVYLISVKTPEGTGFQRLVIQK